MLPMTITPPRRTTLSPSTTLLLPLASLAVPDRPRVLSLVTPPLVMVVVVPVSVLIVVLIVSVGGVVSTVAVTADVVVAVSVVEDACAVELFLLPGRARVVALQLPALRVVAAGRV